MRGEDASGEPKLGVFNESVDLERHGSESLDGDPKILRPAAVEVGKFRGMEGRSGTEISDEVFAEQAHDFRIGGMPDLLSESASRNPTGCIAAHTSSNVSEQSRPAEAATMRVPPGWMGRKSVTS